MWHVRVAMDKAQTDFEDDFNSRSVTAALGAFTQAMGMMFKGIQKFNAWMVCGV